MSMEANTRNPVNFIGKHGRDFLLSHCSWCIIVIIIRCIYIWLLLFRVRFNHTICTENILFSFPLRRKSIASSWDGDFWIIFSIFHRGIYVCFKRYWIYVLRFVFLCRLTIVKQIDIFFNSGFACSFNSQSATESGKSIFLFMLFLSRSTTAIVDRFLFVMLCSELFYDVSFRLHYIENNRLMLWTNLTVTLHLAVIASLALQNQHIFACLVFVFRSK